MRAEGALADRSPRKRRRTADAPRKMSKLPPAVNGADDDEHHRSSSDYAAADESVVRQLQLAAAIHDPISCTKSGGFLGAARDPLGDRLPKKFGGRVERLRRVLFVQLELIKQLEEEGSDKKRQIAKFEKQVAMLKARLERRDHRVSLLRRRIKATDEETKTDNSSSAPESAPVSPVQTCNISTAVPTTVTATEPVVANSNPSTLSSINLVTRYFGRRSKTIPSRALKRRYLGPPKSVPSQKVFPKAFTSTQPLSSPSEICEKTETSSALSPPVTQTIPLVSVKRLKKRGRQPKGLPPKLDYLTTDKPYYVPVNNSSSNVFEAPKNEIHVPCWKLKPVTSFYQMEGTENINDIVFERRHLKFEKEEKRFKRWDIQRIREQKACEKLKNKHCKKPKKEPENPLEKMQSLHPDPYHIQYIEVTDQLPVIAFGHLIPVFQPSEFSLPWKKGEKSYSVEVPPTKASKRCRQTSTSVKVT